MSSKSIAKRRKERKGLVQELIGHEEDSLHDSVVRMKGGVLKSKLYGEEKSRIAPWQQEYDYYMVQMKKLNSMVKGFKISSPVWDYEKDPDYISALLEEFKFTKVEPMTRTLKDLLEQKKRATTGMKDHETKLVELRKELKEIEEGKSPDYVG